VITTVIVVITGIRFFDQEYATILIAVVPKLTDVGKFFVRPRICDSSTVHAVLAGLGEFFATCNIVGAHRATPFD
jgi:hypothetical protein